MEALIKLMKRMLCMKRSISLHGFTKGDRNGNLKGAAFGPSRTRSHHHRPSSISGPSCYTYFSERPARMLMRT